MQENTCGHVTAKALTAIHTQKILTYGLSRSPTRAAFQKMPKILSARVSAYGARGRDERGVLGYKNNNTGGGEKGGDTHPSLCRSMIEGIMLWA